MQQLSFDLEFLIRSIRPINSIAEYGGPEVLEMDADLMGSSCENIHFDQRKSLIFPKNAHNAFGFPSRIRDAHLLAVDRVAPNGGIDKPFSGTAGANSKVGLLHSSFRKGPHQRPVCLGCFGGDENSRSVLIDPMDNARTQGIFVGKRLAME